MPARQRKPPSTNLNETGRKQRVSQAKRPPATSSSRCTICCLTVTVVLCLIQTLCGVIFLIPSQINAVSFGLPAPPVISNSLPVTSDHTERLLENQVIGPESIVSYGDYLYTGTLDRGVLRINKQTYDVQELPPLGKPPCGPRESEPTCGRPLGVRVFKNFLYVLDAYLGMFKYDLKDLKKQAVLVFDNVTFGNDFAIDSQGLIYFTDSSTQWDRRNFQSYLLENSADGLLVQYDESTGKRTVLSDSLAFANGVELSHTEDFVVVCETNRARIARYWLRGSKKGFWDYFNPNLPGLPDNIRRSTRGTYWVALASVRPSFFVDTLSQWPSVRNQMAKISWMFPELIKKVIPKHGMLLEMNNDGKILRVFEDETGSVFPSASEVEETADGVLYLGSYALPYLTKFTPEQFH